MKETTESAQGTKPRQPDRRRIKTRQALLAAALELVLDRGFDATTSEDIAETADVGRRTFYNHFDNKANCLLAALSERYAAYAEASASDAERSADPVAALAASAKGVFDRVVADPVTAQLVDHPKILADAIEASQQDYLLTDLAHGFRQGVFNPPGDLVALKSIIQWGFVGLVLEAVSGRPGKPDGDAWARFMLHNLGAS